MTCLLNCFSIAYGLGLPDSLFSFCAFCFIFYAQRFYAQSHCDDSHVHATTLHMHSLRLAPIVMHFSHVLN